MSDGQRIRLSGTIYVGNSDQAKVIYLVLAALGWTGGVQMMVAEGDTETTTMLDTSDWRIA